MDPKVKQLMDMGFSETSACGALSATEGDVEQATVLLVDNPSFSFVSTSPTTSSGWSFGKKDKNKKKDKESESERKGILIITFN